MVLLSGERLSEPIYPPAPFGEAVGNFPFADGGIEHHHVADGVRAVRGGELHEIVLGREGSLFLGVVHADGGVEHEVAQALSVRVVGGRVDAQPPEAGGLRREVHRHGKDHIVRDAGGFAVVFPIVAAFQEEAYAARYAAVAAAQPFGGYQNALEGLRFGEFVLDPGGFLGSQGDAFGQEAVGQHVNGKPAFTGTDGGAQFLQGTVGIRETDGHHGDILVPGFDVRGLAKRNILVFPYSVKWFRKGNLLCLSGDLHGTPDQFFHGIFPRDPGSAGGTPARRTGYGHLDAQGIGQVQGVAERLLPGIRQIGDTFGYDLRNGASAGIELVQAGDAHFFHP